MNLENCVQILDKAVWIPHGTNTLMKGTNPVILLPTIGK